jgi:predicted nucleic acid-binding protein
MTDRLLPDTSVLSGLRDPRGEARVRAAVARVARALWLSVIAPGETFRRIRQPPPSRSRDGRAAFYDGIVAERAEPILLVSLAVARAWADLAAAARGRGRVLLPADGLIAATAPVHDLTLRTRNTGDVDGTGVRRFDPWQA